MRNRRERKASGVALGHAPRRCTKTAITEAFRSLFSVNMNIEVRLFATLRKYLPAGGERTRVIIDLPAGTSIAEVFTRLGIPAEAATLVLVNGRFEADRLRRLDAGCVLSIFPPIAGG
jgi:sulfur-carrier protein